MPEFIVRPLGRDVTSAVRATLRAPEYGHPVHRELAKGTGPCRECLSTFTTGADERLLFTYNAHAGADHIPRPGPVFIHAESCAPWDGAGFPPGLRDIPVVAEPHRRDGAVGPLRPLSHEHAGASLDELLRDDAVEFVHLRHAEAGCYIARVERMTPQRGVTS